MKFSPNTGRPPWNTTAPKTSYTSWRSSEHKKQDNTLLYVQLDEKLFKYYDDNFTVRVAHNIEETIPLIEAGFEYVTGEYNDGGKVFKKRK
jgi:hypothetical protein